MQWLSLLVGRLLINLQGPDPIDPGEKEQPDAKNVTVSSTDLVCGVGYTEYVIFINVCPCTEAG